MIRILGGIKIFVVCPSLNRLTRNIYYRIASMITINLIQRVI